MLLGFLAAALFALPLALLVVHWRTFGLFLSPALDFARYIPVPALVPLSIIWIGVGESQKVAVLFVGTFFQLLVMTADAVRRVPLYHTESALTLGVPRRNLALSVLLPAASPQIYDACRVCIGLTWSYVMVAELVASERGIGYGIIRAQRFLQTDQIIVSVIALGLIGIAYDRIFVSTKALWFPWDDGK